ncbi:MAG TPA: PilZ domain-containing protein [Myxococcales bacterium]|jgi:c-di-GMP-binding flagellar brake protein YcgR
MAEQPKLKQPLTLEYLDAAGRTIFEGVVSQVGDGQFQASLAPNEALLDPGDEVRVRYCDEKGLCFFSTRVLEVTPGKRATVWLGNGQGAQRSQRRRFMRLGVQVPASCVRLDAKGSPREECATTTLELGGNGAGILSNHPFTVGERVRFTLDFGEEWGRAQGVATVKRSVLALTPEGAEHRVALQFTEIDAKSQAKILSYLVAARAEGIAVRPESR